jgi:hypothetical protein
VSRPDPTPRIAVLAAVVAALGVIALLAIPRDVPERDATTAVTPAPPLPGAAPETAPAEPGGEAAAGEAPAEGGLRPPSARWEATVRAALEERLAAEGLADRLGPADREALLAALVGVRRASLAARRRGHDHAWQVAQSRALIEADRLFRDKLGIGISEFIAEQSAGEHVVDLGAADR